MKVALAQLNYHTGNFKRNTEKIIEAITEAQAQQADIVVFAELAICGYPPRDFLEFEHFIEQSQDCIEKISKYTSEIAVVVGCPRINLKEKGKPLYNSAYFIYDGEVKSIADKALLPTYDVFDEYRYFEPATEFQCVEFKGQKIALTICEDLWNIDNNPLYTLNPMDVLIEEKPDFAVNIAASPFSYTQRETREEVIRNNVEKYKIPFLYLNHVGAQTELIFDGGSFAMNTENEKMAELPYFKEFLGIIDTESEQHSVPEINIEPKIARMHKGLIMGIQDYFRKMGFTKAILGLSGGIDSALVLALAAEALGSKNILAVLMPSQYSSEGSINDSVELCENYNVDYKKIGIEPIFETFTDQLNPHFEQLPENIAEENLQARSRGVLLMALSNKFGHILLNTSNKSEMSVGYSTLYGDMCGGLAVIGDVYKTEVYEMCRHINRDREFIPENIITKPPSAELKPDQKDSDSLPDYDILDSLLYQYIEERKGPRELAKAGFDEALIARVLKMVNQSEYKRFQSPPILRVSPKAFGMGRRLPIVAKYLS